MALKAGTRGGRKGEEGGRNVQQPRELWRATGVIEPWPCGGAWAEGGHGNGNGNGQRQLVRLRRSKRGAAVVLGWEVVQVAVQLSVMCGIPTSSPPLKTQKFQINLCVCLQISYVLLGIAPLQNLWQKHHMKSEVIQKILRKRSREFRGSWTNVPPEFMDLMHFQIWYKSGKCTTAAAIRKVIWSTLLQFLLLNGVLTLKQWNNSVPKLFFFCVHTNIRKNFLTKCMLLFNSLSF